MAPGCRLHLAGRICLEGDGGVLTQEELPRRQGRLALARLGLLRPQPVPREDLIATLWPEGPPPSLDAALNAVVSKLRRALAGVGLAAAVDSGSGWYALRLPAGSWVDLEYAGAQLDLGEGALRRGGARAAWAPATVAMAVLRRPFLPGEQGPWVEAQRRRLEAQLLRAADCMAEAWLALGEGALAARVAEEALVLAPFREASHRQLMRAHAIQGNPAEAVLAFHRCRALLVEELGVEPDAGTRRLVEDLLRAAGRA